METLQAELKESHHEVHNLKEKHNVLENEKLAVIQEKEELKQKFEDLEQEKHNL